MFLWLFESPYFAISELSACFAVSYESSSRYRNRISLSLISITSSRDSPLIVPSSFTSCTMRRTLCVNFPIRFVDPPPPPPASEVRWLKPRLISCFPMADVCCDCCDAVKLFCVTNCAGPFLWLLDVDDDAADCFLWLFGWSCCCDADGGDGKFDDDSLALLWFLRNFVRKPLSGG